uniref:Uncharacterized protein n=1 Tax=Vespula pensylvanica TaxID=30213 RepID=A0A834PB75_VESPE|nr:hypothetical protein H0235_003072 [Vespula pensylvanica]
MSFDSILQVLDEILYQSERILVRKLETPFYGDRANQPIPSVPDEIEKKKFSPKTPPLAVIEGRETCKKAGGKENGRGSIKRGSSRVLKNVTTPVITPALTRDDFASILRGFVALSSDRDSPGIFASSSLEGSSSKKEQRKETIWQRLGQLVASCPETTAAASHATVERRTTRIREDRVRSSISDASSRGNGTKCVRRIVDRHGKKIAVAQSDIEAESLDSILDDGETVVVFFRRSSYSFERSQ